jgi:hypothetical protein
MHLIINFHIYISITVKYLQQLHAPIIEFLNTIGVLLSTESIEQKI